MALSPIGRPWVRRMGCVLAQLLVMLAAGGVAADEYGFSIFAGEAYVTGISDGTNGQARFNMPTDIVVDSADNLYVADSLGHTIRKISPQGAVATWAGVPGLSGTNDGTRNSALFSRPLGLAIDRDQNLYVTDADSSTIRKITTDGTVLTLAGIAGQPGYQDGAAEGALFSSPWDMALDAASNLYVVDLNGTVIRKIDVNGMVTTVAGTPGRFGKIDGAGSGEVVGSLADLAVDPRGGLYFSHAGGVIGRVELDGSVSRVAGRDLISGFADGSAAIATFGSYLYLAVDGQSNLLVVDQGNNALRRVTRRGNVITLAKGLKFSSRQKPVFDSKGRLFLADASESVVWVANPPARPRVLCASSQMVASGERFELEASVTTVFPPAFQWYHDGVLLPGATNDIFSVEAATLSDGGRYEVTAAVNGLSLTSAIPAIIHVSELPPVIVRQLTNQAIVPGSNTVFHATVAGSSPVTYQWSFNGHSIEGETNEDLILRNPTAANEGTYSVAAANAFGSVQSVTVALGHQSLWFVTSPGGLDLPAGDSGTLMGIVASPGTNVFPGTGDFATYQWQLNGADLPGQTNNTLMIASAGPENAGAYTLVGRNTSDSITSSPPAIVTVSTQAYNFSVLAGSPTASVVDGPASAARFAGPAGIAIDPAGNIYVAESLSHCVRKIDLSGNVSTLAGFPGHSGIQDGVGPAARFQGPQGITADANGNVYVVEPDLPTATISTQDLEFARRIRRIDRDGRVTTVAVLNHNLSEPGATNYFHLDPQPLYPIPGSAVLEVLAWQLGSVSGLGRDRQGRLYVSDFSGAIYRIEADGTGAAIAPPVPGMPALPGVPFPGSGQYDNPNNTAADSHGNVYVCWGNGAIGKLSPEGKWSVFAGCPGVLGYADGAARAARFNQSGALAIDAADNLFVADFGNNSVRKITPAGMVSTVAGNPASFGQASGANGAAYRNVQPPYKLGMSSGPAGSLYVSFFDTMRKFSLEGEGEEVSRPWDLSNMPHLFTVAPDGSVYFADEQRNLIERVTPWGTLEVVAGTPDVRGFNDGVGTNAVFNMPTSVALGVDGGLYVADSGNGVIRKIGAGGEVTTFAGAPGEFGLVDGVSARFEEPNLIIADGQGGFWVSDGLFPTIRKIGNDGSVRTIYTNPSNPGAYSLVWANGMGALADGSLLVSDAHNHVIWKLSQEGVLVPWVGQVGKSGDVDGWREDAEVISPQSICVLADGSFCFLEGATDAIRRVAPNGQVSLVAPLNRPLYSLDGLGTHARFDLPLGLARDSGGNLYVAETGAHIIRKISPNGTVETVAGIPGKQGNADGPGRTATFSGPQAVAVGPDGSIYVADTGNNEVRTISPDGMVSTLGSLSGVEGTFRINRPGSIAVDRLGHVFVASLSDRVVQKISPGGEVAIAAGNAAKPASDIGDGFTLALGLQPIAGIATDDYGYLYVLDPPFAARIGPDGWSSALGSPKNRNFTSGNRPSVLAGFPYGGGIAVDRAMNVYIASSAAAAVSKITTEGLCQTLCDGPNPAYGEFFSLDGQGTDARFNRAHGIVVDERGGLFAVDALNNSIRTGVLIPESRTQLKISQHGAYVVGRWLPGLDISNIIEAGDSLRPGAAWAAVTDGFVELDSRRFFTAEATNSAGFFRMRAE